MSLFLWCLHMPRYFLGHVFGHAALLVKFVSLSLDGMASALMEIAAWLADVTDEDEFYGDFDSDDDDDEGLAT